MTSPYSKSICHPRDLAEHVLGRPGTSVEFWNCNFTKLFGLQRLGLHYQRLPAGRRTSLPHAESLEEEFVYVISGNPHVWLDGHVYQLHPGCAAGFPAGTGVAHSFINNTASDVELLIAGERTKQENLCSFPVNPEEKATCAIWWEDAPKRALGPHNGQPGPLRPEELGQQWPSCLMDCASAPFKTGWSYPGDSELFTDYVRPTDNLGLQFLGLGYEIVHPGRRSSFPHAHKVQEEFLFVLSGQAKIWMNGFIHEVGPGMAVGWPPGTNIAHTVINDSQTPLVYFIVGEAKDEGKLDRVYYPLNPARNEQCKERNFLWEDRPEGLPFGPHDGKPARR